MHVAVAKAAPEGQNFVAYVEYLSTKGYVPPDAKDWVDHIRKAGNEANHEIKLAKKDEAEELLFFLRNALKNHLRVPCRLEKAICSREAKSVILWLSTFGTSSCRR